jgi:ketosteroid isomerase-like protein
VSQENVEALRRILSLPPDRAEEFLALLDEDVVWDPGSRFTGGKAYGQWIGAFDDFRYEAVEFIDAGDSVFVHMRQSGRGKASGVATDIDFWQVWLFFEGKIVRFVMKPSRDEALEAAGLAE